jgi:hypothetical protein
MPMLLKIMELIYKLNRLMIVILFACEHKQYADNYILIGTPQKVNQLKKHSDGSTSWGVYLYIDSLAIDIHKILLHMPGKFPCSLTDISRLSIAKVNISVAYEVLHIPKGKIRQLLI